MNTIFKEDKTYKRVNTKELVDKMAYYIMRNMDIADIRKYRNNFLRELDYNVYRYGNLDIYDYDLWHTLYTFGLRNKAVTNYHKNLDTIPFPYKYREAIRNTYMHLVRLAIDKILKEVG